MTSLSTLLNPAPSAILSTLEPPRDDSSTRPAYAGQYGRAGSLPSLDVRDTLKAADDHEQTRSNASPGSPLDTLAAAAAASSSATAYSYSPIQAERAVASGFDVYQSTYIRPSPSQVATSPTIQSPTRSRGQFSPGLEQYHQSTGQERRARSLSERTGPDPRILPPLITLRERENPSGYAMQVDQLLADPATHSVRSEDASVQKNETAAHGSARGAENGEDAEKPEVSRLHVAENDQSCPPRSEATANESIDVQVKTESVQPLSPTDKTQSTGQSAAEQYPVTTDSQPKPEEASMEPSHDQSITATVEMKPDVSETAPVASPTMPAKKKAAPKKRPASKKGTASIIKPPSKKRKLDVDSVASSPPLYSFLRGTPGSNRASKTPTPRNLVAPSQTPTRSSSVVDPRDEAYGDEDEEDDEAEDDEVFCVCRRPDDHTWMIACDGSCNDWYHGKCVNMDERDGNLIDKYICKCRITSVVQGRIMLTLNIAGPNCKDDERQTVYKPKCRLEGCRAPANLNIPSKYCSEEHGVEFMRHLALKRPPDVSVKDGSNKKRRKSTHGESFVSKANSVMLNGETHRIPDTPPHLRGGVLDASELKALVTKTTSVGEFKTLGNSGSLPTPPASSGPPAHSPDLKGEDLDRHSYTVNETAQLNTLATKISSLTHEMGLLTEREKLCMVIKARARAALEALKERGESLKEICGYDVCLAWSMPEFEAWSESAEGKSILKFGNIKDFTKIPGGVLATPIKLVDVNARGSHRQGKVSDTSEDPPASPGKPAVPATTAPETVDAGSSEMDSILQGICPRKRCTRHRDWFKYETQGLRSEREQARQDIERLKGEEREIRMRAAVRIAEEQHEEQVVGT